jgi:hypothetical protein
MEHIGKWIENLHDVTKYYNSIKFITSYQYNKNMI